MALHKITVKTRQSEAQPLCTLHVLCKPRLRFCSERVTGIIAHPSFITLLWMTFLCSLLLNAVGERVMPRVKHQELPVESQSRCLPHLEARLPRCPGAGQPPWPPSILSLSHLPASRQREAWGGRAAFRKLPQPWGRQPRKGRLQCRIQVLRAAFCPRALTCCCCC